jgi:phosphopantothenoylcysteine decarboxylase/phosphopantothenate--cysteine ligase
VTLVTGPVALTPPDGIRVVQITSAREMHDAVLNALPEQDLIVKAAAVGDYRPAQTADDKIKKKNDALCIELVKNPDILQEIGNKKRADQTVCGFSMETRDLLEHSRLKLEKKNCDMMVANNLKIAGAGFGHDTNVVTLLFRDGSSEAVPLMQKSQLADLVLDRLMHLHRSKRS